MRGALFYKHISNLCAELFVFSNFYANFAAVKG